MQSSIIQRIVGAIVLAVIIAILWSLVFEDFEPEKLNQNTQIPETPAFEKFEVKDGSILVKKQQELEEKQEIVERQKAAEKQTLAKQTTDEKEQVIKPIVAQTVKSQETTTKKATSKVESTKPVVKSKTSLPPVKSAPKYDENKVPVTWVVQVASFSSEDNAKKLLKRLVDKKYKAYIRTNSSGGKTIYRLKIGPFIDLAKAKRVNTEIKRNFKLDGLVSRYRVH